jgi:hypothetical protein
MAVVIAGSPPTVMLTEAPRCTGDGAVVLTVGPRSTGVVACAPLHVVWVASVHAPRVCVPGARLTGMVTALPGRLPEPSATCESLEGLPSQKKMTGIDGTKPEPSTATCWPARNGDWPATEIVGAATASGASASSPMSGSATIALRRRIRCRLTTVSRPQP